MANNKIDQTKLAALAAAARAGNAESGTELAALFGKLGKKALQEKVAANPELLLFMAERAMIPTEDVDKYLLDVSWIDHPAVIEKLLRYKKNPPTVQTEAAEQKKAAAEADPKNDWMTEKLPDGTLKLESYKGTELDVVVPTKLGKAAISTIGALAFTPKKPRLKKELGLLRAQIRSVEIPEGITTLESDPGQQYSWQYIGMFEGCDKLKTVRLPDSVKAIPRGMFRGSGISQVVLPEALETIGEGAFRECANLKRITLPGHIRELGEELFLSSKLEEFCWPENDGSTTLPSRMFNWCIKLQRVELPNNLTAIGPWAFSGCAGLAELTLPDTVREIEQSAFSNCQSLRELRIPEGVRAIREGTFSGCKKLMRLYLPASVETIEPGQPRRQRYVDTRPFAECEKLVICAPAGSYAESFAKKTGIPFEAV